ncbi:MAG: hypothetical protein OEM15_03490 [Myxococcales bacterium]|nr:hypothetical protein [Myxococcales bacterium]MDH3486001.1 hypothetical protein [Myxococcales bacterium]
MSSGGRELRGSAFPSVLGTDGDIDLTGELASPAQDERPTNRPSGDAWVIDRDRRSLPPPAAQPPTLPAPAYDESGTTTRDEVHREIADRFALGDYAGALSAAELQLGREPEDDEIRRYAESSRERLEVRYATRIGSLDYVFNVSVAASKIKWLGLDPQAAFLLSLVDGQTSVGEVLDLCQMGRLEALRVFTELLDANAIKRVA